MATFGVLRNADHYRLSDLIHVFHERHPNVQIRLVGVNSVEVAAAVAAGDIDAGIVVLPVEDEGLADHAAAARRGALRVRRPGAGRPADDDRALASAPLILYDAHYGWSDPTRHQLAVRAQLAGVRLEPIIEVEHVELALDLVARGAGDTIVAGAVAASRVCPPGVYTVGFTEPLWDTVALIQREAATLPPATQEIARLAREMLLDGA